MRKSLAFVFNGRGRRMTVVFLATVLVAATFLFSWLGFSKQAKKTNAAGDLSLTNGQVIGQDDFTKDGSGTNITIGNGVTAYIDGAHTFNNLTIEDGGTLTTTDYNMYGVDDVPGRTGTINSTGDRLSAYSTDKYVFIVRGLINVGANASSKLVFAPTGGYGEFWGDTVWKYNTDDGASVEFYPSISTEDYDSSHWSGGPVGYGYSNISGSKKADRGRDAITTNTKRIIPFEYRYYNAGGAATNGLSYCLVSSGKCLGSGLQDADGYVPISVLDADASFASDSTTPQMKTFEAWQGVVDIDSSSYTNFKSGLDAFKSGNGYQATKFYHAANYDFANDKKIILANDEKILTNPTIEVPEIKSWQSDPNSYFDEVGFESGTCGLEDCRRNDRRDVFYNFNGLASRVAGFEMDWPYEWRGFPIISQALFQTMAKKVPTKITLTGTLTVKSNGKINVNGKGFAPSGTISGTGPGGSVGNYPGYDLSPSGSSHSGRSGPSWICKYGWGCSALYSKIPQTYDVYPDIMPALPGSGTYAFYMGNEGGSMGGSDLDPSVWSGYGGGYINILAQKIDLQAGSMVMANGVSGNSGHPIPGPSGGSIILQDSDSSSSYNGVISANGGPCREMGGSGGGQQCYSGGGGGGYIYILTKTDTSALGSRIDMDHYAPVDATSGSVTPSVVFNPTSSYWDKWFESTNLLTVMGGSNEGSSDLWGQPGIISIVPVSPEQKTDGTVLFKKDTYSDKEMTKKESTFENGQTVYVRLGVYQPKDISDVITVVDEVTNIKTNSFENIGSELGLRSPTVASQDSSKTTKITFTTTGGMKQGMNYIKYSYVADD